MKTNKIVLMVMVSLFVSLKSYSQLKVDKEGRIGMGTNWPNPEFKCHIKGNLLLTNFPTNPTYEFRMKVGNGWPGVEIGSNKDIIAMWSSIVNFNKIYAEQYFRSSDKELKSNIQQITGGLNRVMKLKAYSYDMVDNKVDSRGNKIEGTKKEFGFISQEVEKLFPEVKITGDAKGIKLMDYDQIIPLVVSSTQEQQVLINSLNIKIVELEKRLDALSKGSREDLNTDPVLTSEKTVLFQNQPNPFNEKTIIKYKIETNNFHSASIMIFDLNGVLLKSYPAYSGENDLTIDGNALNAGMYIYSLVVNDKELDSKRMILRR